MQMYFNVTVQVMYLSVCFPNWPLSSTDRSDLCSSGRAPYAGKATRRLLSSGVPHPAHPSTFLNPRIPQFDRRHHSGIVDRQFAMPFQVDVLRHLQRGMYVRHGIACNLDAI